MYLSIIVAVLFGLIAGLVYGIVFIQHQYTLVSGAYASLTRKHRFLFYVRRYGLLAVFFLLGIFLRSLLIEQAISGWIMLSAGTLSFWVYLGYRLRRGS